MYENTENDFDLIKGKFSKVILEGSGYEAGQQLAELAKTRKELLSFLTRANADYGKLGFQNFSELQALLEENCPGILDEIQGFSDALDISPKKLTFWELAYKPVGGSFCSQFAALSAATHDSHVYVGRSYDWYHTLSDLTLCVTRIKGKAQHIGCSEFLFGRNDGLNEHGLCASFTGGGIFGVKLNQNGFAQDIAIRTLLDHCKSVDEALARLQQIPLCGFFLLLLVDKKCNAALVEYADGTISVKQIRGREDSSESFLCATNHYGLPGTREYNSLNETILNHSKKRYANLFSMSKAKMPQIRKSDLRRILSQPFPQGVCDHYYSHGFGTLWACMFDLTASSVEICFGAPTHNKWRQLDFGGGPASITNFDVIFPNSTKEWPYS